MTKQQLIDRVAQIRKISKKTAKTAVDLVFDGMTEELAEGGKSGDSGLWKFLCKGVQRLHWKKPENGKYC